MENKKITIAVAGQPNCGKSTVFNALTGASQHVANYPGVTVEKKTGHYRFNGNKVELVDLPGTYSLTSYSLEEMVARDFILNMKPHAVVNIMDASSLKRSLYLTFQLLEMEAPVLVQLNMMDVARRRKIEIDVEKLSGILGVPVVPTSIKQGVGKQELLQTIESVSSSAASAKTFRLNYGILEPFIEKVIRLIGEPGEKLEQYPLRWLAIKLMEDDHAINERMHKLHPNGDFLLEKVNALRKEFEEETGETSEKHIAQTRYIEAGNILRQTVQLRVRPEGSLSDRADQIICHRILGPVILVAVIYLLYQLSIVQGYKLSDLMLMGLEEIREGISAVLPGPGLLTDPLFRSLILWILDSINELLSYIPIFFILFSLIAVLEDSGYMPRMAFILDRVFRIFGLHGHSTLPMILGGVYVGGCAVPAVMATKGIPSERARIATILIIPMLNCLAKVPLYVLLINIYFPGNKGIVLFFMATVTLFLALPMAKFLTLTLLRKKESAPFIMEMPPYHLPTFRGVLGRAFERIWLYVRKIITIVICVSVILFVLFQLPGVSKEKEAGFRAALLSEKTRLLNTLHSQTEYQAIKEDDILPMIRLYYRYEQSMEEAGTLAEKRNVDEIFSRKNPLYHSVFKAKIPYESKEVETPKSAFLHFVAIREDIKRQYHQEKINSSFLGKVGKTLAPVTQYAGFNWRINVALLSALAAKESSVATLGVLYQSGSTMDEDISLEKRMKKTEGNDFTPLSALAVMLFMALYPACVPTLIMIRVQTGQYRWVVYSLLIPTILGLFVSTMIYSGGLFLGLTGLEAMLAFYAMAVFLTLAAAVIPYKEQYE